MKDKQEASEQSGCAAIMYGYQATVPPAGHKPPELPPLQRDLRVRMEREHMVVPGPPPVDISTLREVLLAMEAEHRDLKAVVDTKADRKEVVFRHEIDALITKVCTSIIDRRMKQLEDEYAEFKGVTIRRLNKAEEEIPVLRNRLLAAQDQITKQGTK